MIARAVVLAEGYLGSRDERGRPIKTARHPDPGRNPDAPGTVPPKLGRLEQLYARILRDVRHEGPGRQALRDARAAREAAAARCARGEHRASIGSRCIDCGAPWEEKADTMRVTARCNRCEPDIYRSSELKGHHHTRNALAKADRLAREHVLADPEHVVETFLGAKKVRVLAMRCEHCGNATPGIVSQLCEGCLLKLMDD